MTIRHKKQTPVALLLSLLYFTTPHCGMAQKNTVLKLKQIKETYLTDSVHRIELLAGQKFHQILNEYRLKKNKNELTWNDSLWLTADNHNYFMVHHQKLSHQQNKFSKFFSGKSPLERLQFVVQEKKKIFMIGENIQYFSVSEPDNIEQMSNDIAKEAFKNWKESKPHHKNMLDKDYKKHGVAFKIDELKVWGTNVFKSN